MKMLLSVVYKEFLQLKRNRMLIRHLALHSIGFGLLLPVKFYLILIGVLEPGLLMGGIVLPEAERVVMVTDGLENFAPLLLPTFMSLVAAFLAIPSIASETEHRTLERLLSLPLSWIHVFMGKFLFALAVSLVGSYIMVLTYFALANVIVEEFHPLHSHFDTYLLLFVPAVTFYMVSVGVFASARARTVGSANVLGMSLTMGLSLLFFLVLWRTGVLLGKDIILTSSLLLFVISATLVYLTARLNPEKLLI
ncbi:MAG: hypothetical protein DDT30_01946 [Dehalococcoidia bacterium]|nr:hypothetical protein [Bacillota bacterium]MBT9141354.1 hypothetical protein [Bacillota bacterium]